MTAAGGILNEDNGQTHHAIDEHEDVGGGSKQSDSRAINCQE